MSYFQKKNLIYIVFSDFEKQLQITELKPVTSYIFLVRAENSHGLSVPSNLSTVVKTLGAENGHVRQTELDAARSFLSGKVKSMFLFNFRINSIFIFKKSIRLLSS